MKTERRPGQGGAADRVGELIAATFIAPQHQKQARAAAGRLRRDPRFRLLTERLHRLGPRPVAELLLEVAAGRDLLDGLEEYAALDPATVARLEARDWPLRPIRMVA